MKKLIFIIAVLVSNITLGAGEPTLNAEITNKLILDLSEVDLDEDYQDFVIVNFYIANNEIQIEEITGTHELLVEKVKNKLAKLKIEGPYHTQTLYRYKFTFEKK